MFFIYNILVHFSGIILRIAALFSQKLSLFVKGRTHVFKHLEQEIASNDRVIWFHTASLGEFEQGLPVMEEVRKNYPQHKIVLTFFSPSGYEVKKNTPVADVVCYLPLDTRSNARRFLRMVHPELAVFVKYEFWPNYLRELKRSRVNTLLISAIFRPEQAFFKPYGRFMRSSLEVFKHLFVQDQRSEKLLKGIGITDVTVSGDTRFDRVHQILSRDNHLDFLEEFKGEATLMVAGSTWPEDEAVLVDYINRNSQEGIKYVIAPHNIKTKAVDALLKSLHTAVIRYTDMDDRPLEDAGVFILDTIGLLTRAYSYADLAYVGGGMGNTGLHNTLEPAVFGVPVIIGPHYKGFREAELLVEKGGILVADDKNSFAAHMDYLLDNQEILSEKGKINKNFIEKSRGAVIQITDFIRRLME